MIGTIRRHQQWLWLVIIAATILSFVYYFSPANRNNMRMTDSSGYNFGAINGEPITMEQMRNASMEARIFMRLNSREWPDQSKEKELTAIARQRLVLNSELEQYHITPTHEAAARYLRQLLGISPDEQVPADKILETLTKLAREGGVSLEDFDHFALHQVGQEYLIAIVAMSGKLITPSEAEVFYRRENQPIEAELVSFPSTNFYSLTKPTEQDIQDFYTKRQADYRVPDRIAVNYIAFPASNYLAKAEKALGTNLNDHIDQEYLQAGAAAFKDASGTQLTPEAAKAKIKKEILAYATLTEARKDANSFVNQLSQGRDETHPYTMGDLAALAKTKNITVKTTEPFEMDNAPKELAVSKRDLRVLFSLREDDPDDKDRSMLYASSPLLGEDAVYVVGLQKRIPSEVQPLSAVHDKVVEDWRQDKALEMAKAAGKRFQSILEDGLKQGKTFDAMCAAQFIRPKKLAPFSLTSQTNSDLPDVAEFEQVQELAGRMQPGQYSPFVPTVDGGFLLYVKARLPVDDALVKRDLPIFLQRMREKLQIAAFQQWFGREYQTRFTAPPGDVAAGG